MIGFAESGRFAWNTSFYGNNAKFTPISKELGLAGGLDMAEVVLVSQRVKLTNIAATTIRQGANLVDDAAKGGKNLLSAGEVLRIENAATRIGKPITVVGSRATPGRVSNGVNTFTGKISDWDYIIEGGLKNSREWSKIKNSLPGAKSIIDNTPSMIDIHKGPLRPGYPSITIFPR